MFVDYIYLIYNTINSDCYIGKTNTTIQVRYKQHIYDAKKDLDKFHIIMKKIGIENWRVIELEKIERTQKEGDEYILMKEQEWIKRLNPSLNTIMPGKTNTKVIDVLNDIIKDINFDTENTLWIKINENYSMNSHNNLITKIRNDNTNEIIELKVGKVFSYPVFKEIKYFIINNIYTNHFMSYNINIETKEVKTTFKTTFKYKDIKYELLNILN